MLPQRLTTSALNGFMSEDAKVFCRPLKVVIPAGGIAKTTPAKAIAETHQGRHQVRSTEHFQCDQSKTQK